MASVKMSLLLCVLFVALAYGRIVTEIVDKCPNGKVSGDKWETNDCKVHYCKPREYTFKECDEKQFDKTRCYIQPAAPNQKYPNCCPSVVCRGDAGFVESKLKAN
ncbi:uncharacterized protein LOC131933458 [Physella acuta]|uniref:uncharacterized protein LOC131933458 n=1 Tax=Physella acuta TaxID=109671 RepID=UPI0027DB64E7|nr:uncharacterized protein LOC131933458 [Physella acuta]